MPVRRKRSLVSRLSSSSSALPGVMWDRPLGVALVLGTNGGSQGGSGVLCPAPINVKMAMARAGSVLSGPVQPPPSNLLSRTVRSSGRTGLALPASRQTASAASS